MQERDITLAVFGHRLKKLRWQHNLTTRELAEHVGVSNATISRYETGKRDPDLAIAHSIATHFGVTLSYLCGEDEELGAEALMEIFNKLSDKSKSDAIKYVTYLYETEKGE